MKPLFNQESPVQIMKSLFQGSRGHNKIDIMFQKAYMHTLWTHTHTQKKLSMNLHNQASEDRQEETGPVWKAFTHSMWIWHQALRRWNWTLSMGSAYQCQVVSSCRSREHKGLFSLFSQTDANRVSFECRPKFTVLYEILPEEMSRPVWIYIQICICTESETHELQLWEKYLF